LKLKDLKAKSYLFQAVDRAVFETILHKETSNKICDSLKKYQWKARAKRQPLQSLKAEFDTLQMKQAEAVSEYLSKTMEIANKLKIHDDKIEDCHAGHHGFHHFCLSVC